MSHRAKGAKGLGKRQHLEYSDSMSAAELDKYIAQEMWSAQFHPKVHKTGWENERAYQIKVRDKIRKRWENAQKNAAAEKKQRKPRQKRDLSPDSRAEERAKREARLGRPVARSPAEAAWNGLKTAGASVAYSAIMKDAEQKGYNVSKTEAAKTAKKHKDPAEAVARARAHHNLGPLTPRKKQKKE